MSTLDDVFAAVASTEGGYTDNPADSGNWSGGRIGSGQLRGTKYGISAAAHPNLDIANLTLDQAKSIFQSEYWEKIQGDALPVAIALVVADAAYNSGPGNAIRWMQQALGVAADGIIGKQTLAAAAKADVTLFCTDFLALRIVFLAGLASWKTFARGWARRVCGLPFAITALDSEKVGVFSEAVSPVTALPVAPIQEPAPSDPDTSSDELNAAELKRLGLVELDHG